jgi:hypothetical protein
LVARDEVVGFAGMKMVIVVCRVVDFVFAGSTVGYERYDVIDG